MLQSKASGGKPFLVAAVGLLTYLIANGQIAQAAQSGCVTCHLDKEMLQKNITVKEGQKSAMQSGAG